MKTKNLFLLHHLGLGDHVSLNGMVLGLQKKGGFKKVFLFCKDKYYSNLKILYTQDNIELIKIGDDYRWGPQLKFVDEFVKNNISPGDEFLRIGYCKLPPHVPCDVYFYDQAGIPYEQRFDGFRFDRDDKEEQRVFEKLNPLGEDYVFVHDDPNRGYIINPDPHRNWQKHIKIIKNDVTESIFHYGKVIENAKEFHCIESCIRCYSEHLNTDKVKLFHHNSVRPAGCHQPKSGVNSRKEWISV